MYYYIIVIIELLVNFSSSTINGFQKQEVENMKSEYLLHYGKEPDLWPITVNMNFEDNIDIFSVPVENAVGTNSINNAITLLRFNDDKIMYDEIRKDFIDDLSSGDKLYLGLFSDSWIGYTRTRGFLLFNLKNKSFANPVPLKNIDSYYSGLAVYDASEFEFLFQECHFNQDPYNGTRYLVINKFDFKGGYKEISRLNAGIEKINYVEPWAVYNKRIFVYDNEKNKLTAYDINFTPIEHPLCDIFNNLERFRRMDQLVIHPNLPLAIITEKSREKSAEYKAYLVCWDIADTKKQFLELLGQQISIFSDWADLKGLYVSDFQFSPDGSWLIFRDDSEKILQDIPNPTFMAMPVDGSLEMPLGKPKILGKVSRENANPTSTAWITKPLSFVVSDGNVLYKWELDKLEREFKE
jgi:hypothetical protein